MPPTPSKGGQDLSIQLVDPLTPVYPGGVVRGRVVRRSHIVAPAASVRVALHGRAKAKLVVDRGNNSKSYYRARFAFWRDAAVAAALHRGPVHVAASGSAGGTRPQTWPFALALPTHTDAAAVNLGAASESQREACFVRSPADPRGAHGVPEQPLPASVFFEHAGFGKSWHGFVEYWLEAELRLDGKGKVFSATLPVRVRALPSPSPPIADFGLATRHVAGCVSSQRLFPGMEEEKLSFKQKTQKFFGSSKVPTWHFALQVAFPTVVQLGNPSTVPFCLRVVPARDRTSEAIRDEPQTVYLKSAVLEIHSTTQIICPGTLDPHDASKTRKGFLGRVSKANPLDEAVVVPSGAKDEPLDLGAVLGVRLDEGGRVTSASRLASGGLETVLPTYVTYCVKLEHTLRWEVQVSVAGESWKCGWNQKIVVLPPVETTYGGVERADAGMAALSMASPPPPPDIEEVPAYEGPSTAAPAYEKVPGGGDPGDGGLEGNGEGSSTVVGKS